MMHLFSAMDIIDFKSTLFKLLGRLVIKHNTNTH